MAATSNAATSAAATFHVGTCSTTAAGGGAVNEAGTWLLGVPTDRALSAVYSGDANLTCICLICGTIQAVLHGRQSQHVRKNKHVQKTPAHPFRHGYSIVQNLL